MTNLQFMPVLNGEKLKAFPQIRNKMRMFTHHFYLTCVRSPSHNNPRNKKEVQKEKK